MGNYRYPEQKVGEVLARTVCNKPGSVGALARTVCNKPGSVGALARTVCDKPGLVGVKHVATVLSLSGVMVYLVLVCRSRGMLFYKTLSNDGLQMQELCSNE